MRADCARQRERASVAHRTGIFMTVVLITGKNVEVSGSFQSYACDKIRAVLQKYIVREVDGHIRLERANAGSSRRPAHQYT